MNEWKDFLKKNGVSSYDQAPDIPQVRVCNQDGEELFRGWYVGHVNRQPCAFGDSVNDADVDHVVAHDSFADWNMPRSIVLTRVTPPHYIEVVE